MRDASRDVAVASDLRSADRPSPPTHSASIAAEIPSDHLSAAQTAEETHRVDADRKTVDSNRRVETAIDRPIEAARGRSIAIAVGDLDRREPSNDAALPQAGVARDFAPVSTCRSRLKSPVQLSEEPHAPVTVDETLRRSWRRASARCRRPEPRHCRRGVGTPSSSPLRHSASRPGPDATPMASSPRCERGGSATQGRTRRWV